MTSTKVLNIVPHLGGGVGTVLLSFFNENNKQNNYEHTVYSLDTINSNSKSVLDNLNIYYEESVRIKLKKLMKEVEVTDIVVIHWWNHPLLYELLVKYRLPKCRLAIWSHVSGNNDPQCFTNNILLYPDKFIFTTPISNKNINNFNNKEQFSTIWAGSNLERFKNIKRKQDDFFTIGYIGTVDYSKIHENFISLCNNVDIPNIRFIVCGDGSALESMKEEVKNLGLEKKIIFTGFVKNIDKYLEQFDIFAYPLTSNHYGTCDQTLAEAMSSGIVPIVFNNEMESYMINNSETGIVVHSEREYIKAIYNLYIEKTELNRLSINARESALEFFSIKSSLDEWNITFKNLLKINKSEKVWPRIFKDEDVKPYELFLESLNDTRLIFENNYKDKILELKKFSSWSSKTKGTVYHYNSFFEYDKVLSSWIKIMEEEE